MPEFSDYTISLKLHHPSQDPSVLTEVFGWSAKPTWIAGAPRHDAAGRPLDGVYKASYAAVGFRHPRGTGLPDSVSALLAVLEGQRQVVKRWIGSGGRVELWLSVYVLAPAGDTLLSESLGRCAALGVDLCLLVSPCRMPEYLNDRANAIRAPAEVPQRKATGRASSKSRRRKARTA